MAGLASRWGPFAAGAVAQRATAASAVEVSPRLMFLRQARPPYAASDGESALANGPVDAQLDGRSIPIIMTVPNIHTVSVRHHGAAPSHRAPAADPRLDPRPHGSDGHAAHARGDRGRPGLFHGQLRGRPS